jgi:hypothetical protein
MAVLGPGIITANVDNDAGGIYTYSVAGAKYGFSLLWTLIPITVALIIVQEMVGRMGVVTGKGLADLIREEYGFRTTFILMVLLIITDLGNTVSEFAGLASGTSVFHMSRFVAVPLGAIFRLAAGREGKLPLRGKGLPGGVRHLSGLPGFLLPGASRLDQFAGQHGKALVPIQLGLPLYGHRFGGDDDRALDAVLSSVRRGGKRGEA